MRVETTFCGWCGEHGDPEKDPGHERCLAALSPDAPVSVSEEQTNVVWLQFVS